MARIEGFIPLKQPNPGPVDPRGPSWTHVVKKGEKLWDIAKNELIKQGKDPNDLNVARYAAQIYSQNKGPELNSTNNLKEGLKLKIYAYDANNISGLEAFKQFNIMERELGLKGKAMTPQEQERFLNKFEKGLIGGVVQGKSHNAPEQPSTKPIKEDKPLSPKEILEGSQGKGRMSGDVSDVTGKQPMKPMSEEEKALRDSLLGKQTHRALNEQINKLTDEKELQKLLDKAIKEEALGRQTRRALDKGLDIQLINDLKDRLNRKKQVDK